MNNLALRCCLPFSFLKSIILFVCLIAFGCTANAQVTLDTAGLKMIDIKGDSLRGYKSDLESYQRIIGNVIITHDGTTMTCDSAHFYFDKNSVEAYSNVNINTNNGTQASGNYIKYTASNHTAIMIGNVRIIDAMNTLFTEELTYNIKTKIGKYFKGGTLQTDETTVSSETGTYNGFSKQAYFLKDVIITNPKYTIESKELSYNTQSKIIKFLDESTIIGESNTVVTSAGTYDSKNESAVFTKRTSVENEDQIIIGNTLVYNDKAGTGKAKGDVIIIDIKNDSKINADQAEYNKTTGYGKASGHVIIEQDGGKSILTAKETEYNKKTGYAKASGKVVLIDTVEQSKLLSGVVEYNENSKFMLATESPKLITLADQDSLYMRGDTMLFMRASDEKLLKLVEFKSNAKKKQPKKFVYNLLFADSTARQENKDEPKLIIANHKVKIFSDSMQAVCDSLSYSQIDSTFKLYKSPIMWSKSQQSNADTIYLFTVNSKLSHVSLRNSAFLISETGYKPMYDQVSGNFIDAYFVNNEINFVHVNQNAESLYYAKDEADAYIGVNKAESAKMDVYFIDKELDHLVMIEDPKGVFYPIDKITEAQKYLAAFKLFTDKKPMSKKEILFD